MKSKLNLQALRRIRQRNLSRNAEGHYQSSAERDRETSEKRKYGAAAAAGTLGLYGAGKAATSKIGSIDGAGIRRIADQLKKFPLQGN